MSFRGKRKDGEDQPSEENDVHAPPKKTSKFSAAAADDSDESDDIVVCEISKNRRVSVRNWNGKIWADIREFYIKDGKQLPGKKGRFFVLFPNIMVSIVLYFYMYLDLKFDLLDRSISNMLYKGVLTEKESSIFVLFCCILSHFLSNMFYFVEHIGLFFQYRVESNSEGNVKCCY